MKGIQYQTGIVVPVRPAVRELVLALFRTAALDLSLLVEEEGKSFRTLSFYVDDRKKALSIRRLLAALRIKGGRPVWRIHRRKDWESRWKKGWKPFPLTKTFQVIPLWQKSRVCPGGMTPVFLDTTSAFGTGLHETTRFTAQFIEKYLGQGDSFLDVGTGTGILAIVALRCGAGRVVGFDIDPSAVKVARQNLHVNGLGCRLLAANVKDVVIKKPFDLVAANLVSPDLIAFRDRIISFVRPGGRLVISGIALKSLSNVRRAFAQAGFVPQKVRRGREWCAVIF